MSTILTNGLKLPDKGSVDWYSDMQNNYAILDGAVGTIADHTAQIAGKAPVAHTHTKSDVTDLFNSANTWSANNTFLAGVLTNIVETSPGYPDLLLRSTDQTWENGSRIFLYSNTHTGQTNGSIYIDVDHGDENNTKSGMIFLPGVFYPVGGGTNGIKLGDSTYKWKTFNGVNPGALSLPISSYVAIDTSNWDLTGATGQSYTPTVDGWLFISIQNIAGNYLSIVSGRGAISIDGTGAQGGLRAMLPVIANESVGITVKTGVIFAARFYPAQGNV